MAEVAAGGHNGSVGSGQSPGSGASLSAAFAYTTKYGVVIAIIAMAKVAIKEGIFIFIQEVFYAKLLSNVIQQFKYSS